MTSKYELYQAHPAQDAFDPEPAILHLKQAEKWLHEALRLAQEGSIESLLGYYQVGYTSGNWHFPTIATHYAHGLGHKLAKMLEEDLLLGTGFHFKYSQSGPQSWYLYYTDPDDAEQDAPSYVRQGLLVGDISIWTRELDLSIHFGDKQAWLDERIADHLESIETEKQRVEREQNWLRQHEQNLFLKLFRPRYLKKLRGFAPRFFERKRHLIEVFEKDVEQFRREKETYANLEQLIPLLNRFEKYGFVITPAKSQAELELEDDQE